MVVKTILNPKEGFVTNGCYWYLGCRLGGGGLMCAHQWFSETCLGVSHFGVWASYWQTVILKWTSNKICFRGRGDPVSKVGLTDSFAVLLFSFTQDVPRDYRHVSLTGVKQRFEDETYGQISKEKVLDIYFLGEKYQVVLWIQGL